MARRKRLAYAGEIYHVMNRGNGRMQIFHKPADYLAFLKLLEEGRQRCAMRILGYCLMPNHWHLVLWPRKAQDLSAFLGWTCSTHVRRLNRAPPQRGPG